MTYGLRRHKTEPMPISWLIPKAIPTVTVTAGAPCLGTVDVLFCLHLHDEPRFGSALATVQRLTAPSVGPWVVQLFRWTPNGYEPCSEGDRITFSEQSKADYDWIAAVVESLNQGETTERAMDQATQRFPEQPIGAHNMNDPTTVPA